MAAAEESVEFALTEEQRYAVEGVADALRQRSGGYVTLGGLAGTGKTSCVRYLRAEVFPSAAVMAYTGKACSVLREREGIDAKTIHATIYRTDEQACPTCKGDRTSPRCRACGNRRRWLVHDLRKDHDVPSGPWIVDESSMVSREILRDLLSFGVPTLFVGDHGQLEPIGDDPGLMKSPDFRLETIHRQAAGSPIIQFAHALRRGLHPFGAVRCLPEGHGEGVEVIQEWPDIGNFLGDGQQVVCGKNRTRAAINAAAREYLGFPPDGVPIAGDKIIFRRNSRDFGVFNGMSVRAASVRVDDDFFWIGWEGGQAEVPCDRMTFASPRDFGVPLPPPARVSGGPYSVHADFAYAITCHSAQGSGYQDVCVIDEQAPIWDPARWRYTAASRAKRRLVWHCPVRRRR